MTAALWFAAVGEEEFLNKLVDKLAHIHFAGYSFETADPKQGRVAVAIAGSIVGAYLTVTLFVIGWMKRLNQALKLFSALTGSLLGFVFCGFWYKFLGDDHIVATSEKLELFAVSMFLGVGAIVLCWFGFRKSSVSSKVQRQATADLASEASQVSYEKPVRATDESDIPSTESLLSDEVPAAGEEGTASPDDDSEEEPSSPLPETEEEEVPSSPLSDDAGEAPVVSQETPTSSEEKEYPPPVQESEEDIPQTTPPLDEPELEQTESQEAEPLEPDKDSFPMDAPVADAGAEAVDEPPPIVEESSPAPEQEPDAVAPPLPVQDVDEPPPLPLIEPSDLDEPPPLPPLKDDATGAKEAA